MLTSTYTLVALSVEQTAVRSALQSLTCQLHALAGDATTLDPDPVAPAQASQLCTELRQVLDDCHWRKLDKFLVPALRRSTEAADGLLHDLEQLSMSAADFLTAAQACVDAGGHGVHRKRFHDAIEQCIAAMRCRLEREEHELFPLARSQVRGEAWFTIANQMLAHDAVARERRGSVRLGRGRPDALGPRRPLYEPPQGRDALGPEYGRRHASLSMLH